MVFLWECRSPPFPARPDFAELHLGQGWWAAVCAPHAAGSRGTSTSACPCLLGPESISSIAFLFFPLFSLAFLLDSCWVEPALLGSLLHVSQPFCLSELHTLWGSGSIPGWASPRLAAVPWGTPPVPSALLCSSVNPGLHGHSYPRSSFCVSLVFCCGLEPLPVLCPQVLKDLLGGPGF